MSNSFVSYAKAIPVQSSFLNLDSTAVHFKRNIKLVMGCGTLFFQIEIKGCLGILVSSISYACV